MCKFRHLIAFNLRLILEIKMWHNKKPAKQLMKKVARDLPAYFFLSISSLNMHCMCITWLFAECIFLLVSFMYFANNDSKKLIMIAKFSASLTRSHPHPRYRYRMTCRHPKAENYFFASFRNKIFLWEFYTDNIIGGNCF